MQVSCQLLQYILSLANQNISVSYPSKSVMIKSDGLTFGLQEPFLDDSGIGMSLISGDENENPAFAAYTNDLISNEEYYGKQAQR